VEWQGIEWAVAAYELAMLEVPVALAFSRRHPAALH
jgi:hypothetical protein